MDPDGSLASAQGGLLSSWTCRMVSRRWRRDCILVPLTMVYASMQAEMEQLATTVRKVARLLWALHLSFLDGFDEVSIMDTYPWRPAHCSQSESPFSFYYNK